MFSIENNKMHVGRPRQEVNFGLILDYRDNLHLGWLGIANKYTRTTGSFISKQTCKRRYVDYHNRMQQKI
jgi:hypothetical protein